MSAEPRRWVLEPYKGMSNQPSVQKGPDVSAPERVMPVSEHEADLAALREAAQAVVDAAEWLTSCQWDVIRHVPVRGLGEAKAVWESSRDALRAVLASADSEEKR